MTPPGPGAHDGHAVRTPLRQPTLAEMIAGVLRQRMLNGEFGDDPHLPKQEDLLREFGVSKPSMREALRILETEGLITVRRGNVGGAVLHVPRAENAAYTLGLVLEARRVTLGDVGGALAHVAPLCAALCAQRSDRRRAVVPALKAVHAQATARQGDPVELTVTMRRFHETIVELCGNQTLILVVGALESLWTGGEQQWAEDASRRGAFPGEPVATASIEAHEELIRLVAAGDAEGAQRLARTHLEETSFYAESSARQPLVSAARLRPGHPQLG